MGNAIIKKIGIVINLLNLLLRILNIKLFHDIRKIIKDFLNMRLLLKIIILIMWLLKLFVIKLKKLSNNDYCLLMNWMMI
jgi:hypothetical protein